MAGGRRSTGARTMRPGRAAAVRVGGLDGGVRDEAPCAGHEVPLAPADPPAAVLAKLAAAPPVLARGRSRTAAAGCPARPAGGAGALAHGIVDPAAGGGHVASLGPGRERRPKREPIGQAPLGQAAAQDREHGILDQTAVMPARPAAPRGGLAQRRRDGPLGVARLVRVHWLAHPRRVGRTTVIIPTPSRPLVAMRLADAARRSGPLSIEARPSTVTQRTSGTRAFSLGVAPPPARRGGSPCLAATVGTRVRPRHPAPPVDRAGLRPKGLCPPKPVQRRDPACELE